MFGRKRDAEEPPPSWQPMPAGEVRDPEAMDDTAPDPDLADSDDRFW